jgi:hypothetical protein
MPLTTVDQGLLSTNAQYTGFKNRIINGDMQIDQRNNGASVNANSSTAPYVTDRFNVNVGGSSAVIACQQVTDAPANFINSLRLTVSTAATPSSSQFLFVRQIIEGVNIADLGWGTASAQTVTASFWVKASLTGTYALFAINNAEDRSYVGTFSVSASNTWEYKTVTIPGDTTGTWLTNNSNGIRFGFDLGSGSNFNGTANAWQPGWEQRTSSTVNFCQTVGATFQITGVQLEKGQTATSFDVLDYGTELALCQRYYEKSYNTNVAPGTATIIGMVIYMGITDSAGNVIPVVRFAVTKRSDPTLAFFNANTGALGTWQWDRSGGAGTIAMIQDGATGNGQLVTYANTGGSFVSTKIVGHWTASSEL